MPELNQLNALTNSNGKADLLVNRESTIPLVEAGYCETGAPEYVLEFDNRWPKGIAAYLAADVTVAGVSQPVYQQNLCEFIRGTEPVFHLERDPGNANDRFAIKVIGQWLCSSGIEHVEQIGWVPKEVAKSIAKEYPNGPMGARIRKLFLPRRGFACGMRLDIGRPHASKLPKKKKRKPKPEPPAISYEEFQAILGLARANLAPPIFSNKVLRDFKLTGLDLTGADFTGCDLSGADFSDCCLSEASFCRAKAIDARFERADLRRTKFDFAKCDNTEFNDSNMQGASFASASLRGAGLTAVNLEDADLTDAVLIDAEIVDSNLRWACLRRTRFGRANMTGSDITGAILEETKMRGAIKDDLIGEDE